MILSVPNNRLKKIFNIQGQTLQSKIISLSAVKREKAHFLYDCTSLKYK